LTEEKTQKKNSNKIPAAESVEEVSGVPPRSEGQVCVQVPADPAHQAVQERLQTRELRPAVFGVPERQPENLDMPGGRAGDKVRQAGGHERHPRAQDREEHQAPGHGLAAVQDKNQPRFNAIFEWILSFPMLFFPLLLLSLVTPNKSGEIYLCSLKHELDHFVVAEIPHAVKNIDKKTLN
jgi:hypothetical protein